MEKYSSIIYSNSEALMVSHIMAYTYNEYFLIHTDNSVRARLLFSYGWRILMAHS